MNKLRFAFFVLMNIINYILVLLGVLFYRSGAPVLIPLFLGSQFTLVVANYFVSEKLWQLGTLSGHLLISTIIANILSGLMYYYNISSDLETLLVMKYMLIIGCFYIMILSAVAIIVKNKILKNKSSKE